MVGKVLQRGIGLPVAIFTITLLALIAVAIYQLGSQNAASYQEQINLTRAFYAAESGAGFALNSLFAPEDYPLYSGRAANCSAWPAGTGFPRLYEFRVAGLNQCTASVSCADVVVDTTVYSTLTSTGTCDDVTRIVQVRTSYE